MSISPETGNIIIGIMFAMIGGVIGSFCNVLADRIPAGKSIWQPPSHCDGCGRRLTPMEMVPVFSYLVLRGRCRTCGQRVPKRVLWVELITAGLFALIWFQVGPQTWLELGPLMIPVEPLATMAITTVLVALFITDMEQQLLPSSIIYTGLGLAVILALLRYAAGGFRISHYGLIAVLWPQLVVEHGWSFLTLDLISQPAGMIIGFALFWLIWRISRGGMGYGDVRLAALCGLVLGAPGIIAASMASFVLGGLAAVVVLVSRRGNMKTAIPFGPFLILTSFVWMVWGNELMKSYLGI